MLMNKIKFKPQNSFGKEDSWGYLIGMFLSDLVFLIISALLTFWVLEYFFGWHGILNHENIRRVLIPSVIFYLISFYLFDLYNYSLYESKIEILAGLIKASAFSVLLLAAYEFLFRLSVFPRSYVVINFFVSIFLLYFVRTLWLNRFKKLKAVVDRVLFVGTPDDISSALKSIKNDGLKRDCHIVGAVLSHNGVDEIEGVPVLGEISDVHSIIEKNNINRIIVVSPINYREFVEKLHGEINRDIRIEIVPGIYEILIGKPDYALIADIPLIKIVREGPPNWYFLIKRVMDIVVSLLLLILTLPLWIPIAIVIKITSPGPVFYKQKRVGKDGRTFTLWKFRTMINDAEKLTGPTLANKNDSRVTPIGRFLRKYRIDELPQLLMVLKGDMSLVGPRPERVEFVEIYKKKIPFYNERHKVKPGVTGLAQVWGNYSTSPAIKLKYDLIYIYNRSILLDIEILLKTAKVVLKGTGI